MNRKTKRNNFGALSKDYDAARRGYPEAVFRYLKKLARGKQLKVLDIGCGTGISTRQLKQYKFDVIGADKDRKMVRVAVAKRDRIPYVVASVHHLPFKKGEFDVVTAFTAFHWFTDKRSVFEIKRVLKDGGLFFAALKKSGQSKSEQLMRLSEGYKSILGKYFKGNADSTKSYDPKNILKDNGFGEIVSKSFLFDEKYTLPKAMMLVRSISNWNLLPDDLQQNFYGDIKNLYKKNLIKGFVVKNREVAVVAGYLPQRNSK